jgi:hypothetical protein
LKRSKASESSKPSPLSFEDPLLPSTLSYWGWAAPSTTITLELGHDSQRAKELASKLHVHSINYTAHLVYTLGVNGSILGLAKFLLRHISEVLYNMASKSLASPFWWRSFTCPVLLKWLLFVIDLGKDKQRRQ